MPGGDKNIKPEDNTNGFQENPQNINKKGRPKKLISDINNQLKGEGYKAAAKAEITEAYLLLLNLPFDEVVTIAKQDERADYPLLYKLVAKEIIGKRGMEMLEKLLDRGIGKPDLNVEHSGKIDYKVIRPKDED